MKITALITFLVLVTFSRSAHAQWHDAYKNPFSSWGAYMYDQNVKRHLRERTTTTSDDARPAPVAPRAAITATDFKRDAKRKDVVAQFIAQTGLSPADGQTLASQLRATMQQLGSAGRKDNVANAMAIVITVSFAVIEQPDFDEEKADALAPMINDALAAAPQFRKLGAADRQQMYDSLLLSAAVIAMLHQGGEKEQSQTIAKGVLQNLLGMTF